MIIKKAKYQNCPQCGNARRISNDEYGCDRCGKSLDYFNSDTDFLIATAFSKNSDKKDYYHFCSWQCALEKLATLSRDYFVDLPYLHFDVKNKKAHAGNFWRTIEDWVKKKRRKK